MAYRLDLPGKRLHPVISVAHLSTVPDGRDPFYRDAPPPGPVQDNQNRDDEYEIETLLNYRQSGRGSGLEYLIKWLGYNNEYNTWHYESYLDNAKELVDEYWSRRSGGPVVTAETKKTSERRKRGRPRKL